MNRKIFFSILLVLPSMITPLCGQEDILYDAKHLHRDATIGLEALSTLYRKIATLQEQIKSSKADSLALLNTVAQWQEKCIKLESLRSALSDKLERKEAEYSALQAKDIALRNEINILQKEKENIDSEYRSLYNKYLALTKENSDLKLSNEKLITKIKQLELSGFRSGGVKVYFIKRNNEKLIVTDNYINTNKFIAIEIVINLKLSESIDHQEPKKAKVKFNYKDGKYRDEFITLSRKQEDGLYVYSGKYTYKSKSIIKDIDTPITIEIPEKKYLVDFEILFK